METALKWNFILRHELVILVLLLSVKFPIKVFLKKNNNKSSI